MRGPLVPSPVIDRGRHTGIPQEQPHQGGPDSVVAVNDAALPVPKQPPQHPLQFAHLLQVRRAQGMVIESEPARLVVYAIQGAAWLLLLAASFEIDHYETFGLKQPYLAMKGRAPAHIDFQAKRIYRVVRHPIQTGIFVGMWTAPTMTSSRLMFASLMTAYILVGLYFEERDLVRQFGERYRQYRAAVPGLLPWRPPRKLP